jgi:hypothetical protein
MTTNQHHDQILDAVRAAGEGLELSADARDRIKHSLTGGAMGATTLLDRERTWSRRTAWTFVATAAAILAAFWVFPAIDRETTISAAEVLGRSQQALAAPVTGVQVLTYDLMLGGVLTELLPTDQSGSFTVEEIVDHDHPDRFRLLKVAPGGQVVAGVADDSLARSRARYVRLENRGILVRFRDTPATAVSVIAIKRAAFQALIAMMQTSNNASLREIDRGGEMAYEVETPATTRDGLIELQAAKAVVARSDARLLDFNAQGMIGGQPFAITFNFRSGETRAADAVPADAFMIEPAPGDEIIEARGGSPAPLWDVLQQCLRR